MMSGWVSESRSLLPLRSCTAAVAVAWSRASAVVAVGETLAAIVGFVEAGGLDHRAHRAVDDEDALAQAAASAARVGAMGGLFIRGACAACFARWLRLRASARSLRNAAAGVRGSRSRSWTTSSPALLGELAQLLLGEAEVAWPIGLHRAAVLVPAPGWSAAGGRRDAARAPLRPPPAPASRRRSGRASARPGRTARRRRAGRACRLRALRRC